ncbi:MAG TPA: hypothetical protein VMU25_00600 [Candidatus Paceibacterota bacterium]|nr:hypothetical protein [Candidatus Paceibacterota bacterium]
MSKAARAVVFLIASIALNAVPLAAQAAAQPLAQVCKGFTGDPTESRQFLNSDFSSGKLTADSMNTYLQHKVLCPSACWDVSIHLSIGVSGGGYLQIDTTGTNTCTSPQPQTSSIESVYTKLPAPNDSRNCANGKGLPAVTVSSEQASSLVLMFGGSKVPDIFKQAQNVAAKSRCDPNITQTISALSTGNFSQGFSQLSSMQQPSSANVPADTTSLSAIQKAQAAIQSGDIAGGLASLGATPAQVQSVMQGDPQDAKKLLQDLAAGDTASAQQIAAKLNLNPDLASNVFQLNATQSVGNATGAIAGTPTGGTGAQGGDSTFGGTQGSSPVQTSQSKCGVDGIAGSIMGAESNCGQINYNPLSSVQGPYHYLCETWQSDTAAVGMSQYSDCSYRNDVAVSTQVVNARYGLYQQQYGDQCAAAGQSWTSCAYAIHVFGEGGFKNILNAEQSDPNASAFSLCGSAISNSACSNNASIFRNGGTVAGVFSELDRRLGAAATGGIATIPVSTNPILPVSTSPFSGFLGQSTGFNSFTSSIGSPFSAFLSSFISGVSAPSYTYPQQQSVGPTIQYPQGTTAPAISPVLQAASTILVQPQQVAVGKAVLISWSSVGMNSCTVSGNGASIAQSISGTKSITMTTVGTTTFALTCTSADNTVSQHTATVVAH